MDKSEVCTNSPVRLDYDHCTVQLLAPIESSTANNHGVITGLGREARGMLRLNMFLCEYWEGNVMRIT